MKRTLSALPSVKPRGMRGQPTYSERASPWPTDDENADRNLDF